MRFKILFCLILINVNKISSEDWNYNRLGPDVWYKTYPYCKGESQSPINIKTACTIQQKFSPFIFSSNFNESFSVTLFNDGHTIKGELNQQILTVNGGNLIGTYQFINFHVHWGANENVGSEHQINGQKLTGESHFVFENVETSHTIVLGFLMIDVNNRKENVNVVTSNEWIKYFNAAKILPKTNDTTKIILNFSLLMSENLNDFWRYEGSLTVPPCTPNITWTLFRYPILIYNYDFDIFRVDFFYESYRGPQNLYLRQVFRSFPNETVSPIPDQQCCSNQSFSTTTSPINSSSTISIVVFAFFLNKIKNLFV